MRVLVSNYRFPFREELGAWSIVWRELGGSEGYVHLEASISPSITAMVKFLASKGYIEHSIFRQIERMMSESSVFSSREIWVDARTNQILNGLMSFCKSETRVKDKRTWSFWASFDYGNTTRSDKCMKAIKKDLVLEGEETVEQRLLNYLRSHRII